MSDNYDIKFVSPFKYLLFPKSANVDNPYTVISVREVGKTAVFCLVLNATKEMEQVIL